MSNIATKRKEKGILQDELAKEMGIDRSTVAKWETGAAMPRADKLLKLAEIFECSVDDLLKEA